MKCDICKRNPVCATHKLLCAVCAEAVQRLINLNAAMLPQPAPRARVARRDY